MKGKVKCFHGFAWAILLFPWIAEAHPFHWAGESIGFLDGLLHPLTSFEHLLTMLAVGLWIGRTGRRAPYAMPLLFAVLMLAGVGLAMAPIEIAHADTIMSLSVVLLVMMLAFGGKFPVDLGMLVVAILAVFHGYQHAYDIWLDACAMAYTGGFALATLCLIATGIVAGRLAGRFLVKYFLGRFAARFSGTAFFF